MSKLSKLFTAFFLSLVLMFISMVSKDIYLLALSELCIVSISVLLIKSNIQSIRDAKDKN